MALSNMIFFDHNYLEYYSDFSANATFPLAQLPYLLDNRGDKPVATWTDTTGALKFDLGQTITMSDFLFMNHNWKAAYFWYGNDGTVWTSLTTLQYTTTANHITTYINATITARFLLIWPLNTTDGNFAYCGELIATRKKFQLNYNPNLYVPSMLNIGNSFKTYTGRTIWNEIGDQFEAKIGWDKLYGDLSLMSSTDLQNMTELARQKSSFLFWPNGDTSLTTNYPDLYTFRRRDIYKCRILDDVKYDFNTAGHIDIIKALYTITEVK